MESIKSKKFNSLTHQELGLVQGGGGLWGKYKPIGDPIIVCNVYAEKCTSQCVQYYNWFGLHATGKTDNVTDSIS